MVKNKKGGTAHCFSVILVPPSTTHLEKRKQFTPCTGTWTY